MILYHVSEQATSQAEFARARRGAEGLFACHSLFELSPLSARSWSRSCARSGSHGSEVPLRLPLPYLFSQSLATSPGVNSLGVRRRRARENDVKSRATTLDFSL